MKRLAAFLLLILIVLALLKIKNHKEKDYLVKINNYTITMGEFNAEFAASAFAKSNTPESRREFLNTLIRRKLILQDAQAKGLDKDAEFLKSIERFWEQSLLKQAMDKKSQEIASLTPITDSAVETIYNKLKSEGKADKPYKEMYQQIKWSLTQLQESQAMNKWLASLYKKAEIKINPIYIAKHNEVNAKAIKVNTEKK